jgi:hypothetical protein
MYRGYSERSTHQHNWTIGTIKNNFEPVEVSDGKPPVYVMVEYAYLVCKCATVKKTKVTNEEES